MNFSHYLFKPKYGIEVAQKVLECYRGDFLGYRDQGVYWSLNPVKNREGWWEFMAEMEPEHNDSTPSETVWTDEEITGEQMTNHMMVLLIE